MAGRQADLIVVVDASTFVSAALKAKSVHEQALLHALNEPNRLILSQEVEGEYREVILRPKFDHYVSVERRQHILAAERVKPNEAIRECRDPEDAKYVALAAAGSADVIVSGDARHFAFDEFVARHCGPAPRDFLARADRVIE